jgi:hypothetical protein
MARGWESKSVEAQLDEAAAARQAAPKVVLTGEEAERLRRHELLIMSRQRTRQLLDSARNERYRQLLEEELRALDEQIARAG